MQYEVELKFPVDDRSRLVERLEALGAQPGETLDQSDRYFHHPVRDFASTDEALRIRSVGEQNWLTYKGPKLDKATKTRREIELAFESSAESANRLDEALRLLGFEPSLVVRKQRQCYHLDWNGRQVEAVLDEVDGLDSFAELELLADAETLDAARRDILSLAERLELGAPERHSYLELLLARRQ